MLHFPLTSVLAFALASTFVLPLGITLAQPPCGPILDAHAVKKEIGPGENLVTAVGNAASGTTLLIKPGTYKITGTLQFLKSDVTLRSTTGNRDDVILDGNSGAASPLDRGKFLGEIIAVSASQVTLADITIQHAKFHAIHAYPPSSKNIENITFRNLKVLNCGQQQIKVNSNGSEPLAWVDKGVLECSEVGFTDNSVMEPSGDGFYTGGLDVHGGWNWVVRNNLFKGIERNGKLMEHGVHFWKRPRGTVIEGNRFENCNRGIGLGMLTEPDGHVRAYPDDVSGSPYVDHIDGIVRNNVIWNKKGIHLESGIELMNAKGAEVYHNTVFSVDAPFSSIEYRWPNTQVVLKNNLVSLGLMARDGGKAEAAGNLTQAPAGLFEDAAAGDLRLKATAAAAIGKGVVLAADKASLDFGGGPRDAAPDIGAYEYGVSSSLRSHPPRPGTKPRKGMGPNPPSRRLDGRWQPPRPGWNDLFSQPVYLPAYPPSFPATPG